MPKHSVIIPLYNKEKYVVGAINSVLRQTIKDFEIIVVDDGSSDSGVDNIRREISDNRVKILSQKNSGVSVARNVGIRHSEGDYISFLDADDIWHPDKLKEVEMLFSSYDNCAFVGTSYYEFNEPDFSELIVGETGEGKIEIVENFYQRWLESPFVFTSSISVRREKFIENDIFFPVGESLGEDQDVWFRLSELGPFGFSRKKLVGYRRGVVDSLTGTSSMDILPVFMRLYSRVNNNSICNNEERKFAMELFRKHKRDVVLANANKGLRKRSLSFMEPGFLIKPGFMLRYLFLLISPDFYNRTKKLFIKS